LKAIAPLERLRTVEDSKIGDVGCGPSCG
jgi:hypothetical protein